MPKASTRKSQFAVPADLGPNDAHDVHEQLLVWLSSKRSRGTIEISGDADAATISALQLVIAATRAKIERPPAFGPAAERAVAALVSPRVLEHAAP